MKVFITNLYSENTWELEGTPRQLRAMVLLLFPWLRSARPGNREDLHDLLEHLASQQAFAVDIATS